MKTLVRRMSLCLTFLALTMALAVPVQAGSGCAQSCYFVNCIPDHPSIGCVEQWGYCWEVPCQSFASSDACPVDEALTKAFASFGDVTGTEALELLRNNEEYAKEILPYVRVVGENGEVFRGAEYQRPESATKVAEAASEDEPTESTAER